LKKKESENKLLNDIPIIPFKTPKEFERWLSKNHNELNGIWLNFFKMDSGIKSITYREALDEALCYGWIDGQAKPYDEKSWLQKFTPRRKKSIWSKRNTENIKRLTKAGKMKPAGIKEVEAAKADGRWQKAYDSQSNMTIPDDFLKLLSKNKKAKTFFESLNKTNLYSIAWRIQTAKKPETREKRMKLILEMLEKGEKFHG
jgi:uncharacterized protein YdeI (YjbR/CyaY-like superfamily)